MPSAYSGDVDSSRSEFLSWSEFTNDLRFRRRSVSTTHQSVTVVVDCGEEGLASTSDEDSVSTIDIGDLPYVLVGFRARDGDPRFDLVVDSADDLTRVVEAIERRPLAAVATALLLRGGERRSLSDGLVAESTTYSMLQAGPEFQEWSKSRRRRSDTVGRAADPILVERHGGILRITFNDPDRRNAYSSRLRADLADALDVALLDATIDAVELRGAGTNFSSGGDLDEFGSFADPVTAHVSRLSSRVTSALIALRRRLGSNLRCIVHGDNFGAGVELAAFAGSVSAHRSATFTLPEVRMGLTPGSGGTVSLPLRIGRQRTLDLAVTGRTIDVRTARQWGLVDDIVE